jgi:hypothetical protein
MRPVATEGLGAEVVGSASTTTLTDCSVPEFTPFESMTYTETVYAPAAVGVQVIESVADARSQPKSVEDCAQEYV